MLTLKLAAFFGTLHLATAQSFLTAIESYPELSRFAALLTSEPTFATGLLSINATGPVTLLIPNNNAFLSYKATTGLEVASDTALLRDTLNYHTLNGTYDAESFSEPKGVTIPTLLSGERYNNRTAGSALNSAAAGQKDGQVVFISPQEGATSFKVRQLESDAATVRSGLASDVSLTTTEGVWDGGRFHIVDGFLTLPQPCTATITNRSLTSLQSSLERTELSNVLDTLKNVTCLAPNDAAFLAAGSPDSKLDATNLTGALMFHTIAGETLYSNFLTSGQSFQTANNLTVRVTLDGDDIYFNDAKVLEKNVLTNNGLIHVLDRIMSPLKANETIPSRIASSSSASATATATGTGIGTGTGTSEPSPTVSGNSTTFTTVPEGAAACVKENLVGLSFFGFVAVVVGVAF